MKLLVVILNYKVTDLTIDCLRSLQPEVSAHPEFRVAVLENGTGGDAFPRLRRAIDENGWGGWVELGEVQPNRGFTGGNNLVIRQALARPEPPEYFVLLNADTLVRPRALAALAEEMDRRPRAGIGGSALFSPEGVVQASPFRFASILSEIDRGLQLGVVSRLLSRRAVVLPTPPAACAAEWVSGASMILRRTMLEEIGLLDEGLYTYFDDIDICLRARRAGWETWYLPGSQVVHLEGASTGVGQKVLKRRPDYWHQARRRFWLKNYGPAYAAAADAAFLVSFALWRARRAIQGKPDTDPPRMLADAARNSVFRTGFALRDVENPAMVARPGAGGAAGTGR